MGGTAVGTGLNAEPEYIRLFPEILSRLTGFSFKTADNLIDTTNTTDCFADVSGALKVVSFPSSRLPMTSVSWHPARAAASMN